MSKRTERIKRAISKSSQRQAKPSASQTHVSRGAKSASSTNPDREKTQGNWRDAATIRRLNMYRGKPDKEKMREQSTKPARIAPDRRWFGNTRVITAAKLDQFRDTLESMKKDPFSVVIKKTKLPLSLFDHSGEKTEKRMNSLLTLEPYGNVLKRKKGRFGGDSSHLEELVTKFEAETAAYVERRDDRDVVVREETTNSLDHNAANLEQGRRAEPEAVFRKGTSKRIWGELYKVIDSSDIVIFVLDARDPMGTRCMHIEKQLREEKTNKHLVFVINKCDLIPIWVKEKWVKILSKVAPTVAFKSSVNHPYGKKALIGLLSQFTQLIKNRKHLSVGFVGYPNVGKSSVINTLKGKDVCNVAPVPGETKVWQYIALTSKVYLIDCPGVVASSAGDDDTAKVLKGVVRAEKTENPEQYIDAIVKLVTEEKMRARYNIPPSFQWTNTETFLEHLARMRGRLTKGGNPDISIVARGIIYDFQRGKIPYFRAPPPAATSQTEDETMLLDQQNEEEEEGTETGEGENIREEEEDAGEENIGQEEENAGEEKNIIGEEDEMGEGCDADDLKK